MAIIKDEVQILRTYDYSNSSMIVVALGRRLGAMRVLIKGARRWQKRGFEGGFDLLSRGQMLVYARANDGLWQFKEWEERSRPLDGIARDALQALAGASYLAELTDALTRETSGNLEAVSVPEGEAARQTDERYERLQTTTEALIEDPHFGSVLLQYTLQSLQSEGLLPQFDACSSCSRKLPEAGRLALLREDGLFCGDCQPQLAREQADSTQHEAVGLAPESLAALAYMRRSGKRVRCSPLAALGIARAVQVLLYGALEHELKTLPGALALIRESAT